MAKIARQDSFRDWVDRLVDELSVELYMKERNSMLNPRVWFVQVDIL